MASSNTCSTINCLSEDVKKLTKKVYSLQLHCRGPRGIPGEKGDIGLIGSPGVTGLTGPIGPSGAPGLLSNFTLVEKKQPNYLESDCVMDYMYTPTSTKRVIHSGLKVDPNTNDIIFRVEFINADGMSIYHVKNNSGMKVCVTLQAIEVDK